MVEMVKFDKYGIYGADRVRVIDDVGERVRVCLLRCG